MSGDEMVNIVCVQNGTKYPDQYVDRLYSMVERHIGRPFGFTCFTDRPRPLRPEVQQRDCSGWGLKGWFAKLRLFDGTQMPFERFLYLDITLIVKNPLEPLLKYVRDSFFVALRDWGANCFNSSVMWITRHPMTQAVWDNYAAGVKYRTEHHGDQDYIHAVMREAGLLETIPCFPDEMIQSFKRLHRLHARAPEAARKALDRAIILKFHGHPKPHELLSSRRKFLTMQLAHPRMLLRRDWRFINAEIEQWWR